MQNKKNIEITQQHPQIPSESFRASLKEAAVFDKSAGTWRLKAGNRFY